MATEVAGVPGLDPTIPDVHFTANGKQYHLCFDWNAICRIKKETGQNLWEDPGISTEPEHMRFTLWSALLRENPDLTVEQAGALVVSTRTQEVYGKMLEALVGSLPPKEAETEPGNTQNPPSA